MVLGCILVYIIAMLKRRASKRFVLAESGQDDVVWDSSVDSGEVVSPGSVQVMHGHTSSSSQNTLTVPKPAVEMTQGLK